MSAMGRAGVGEVLCGFAQRGRCPPRAKCELAARQIGTSRASSHKLRGSCCAIFMGMPAWQLEECAASRLLSPPIDALFACGRARATCWPRWLTRSPGARASTARGAGARAAEKKGDREIGVALTGAGTRTSRRVPRAEAQNFVANWLRLQAAATPLVAVHFRDQGRLALLVLGPAGDVDRRRRYPAALGAQARGAHRQRRQDGDSAGARGGGQATCRSPPRSRRRRRRPRPHRRRPSPPSPLRPLPPPPRRATLHRRDDRRAFTGNPTAPRRCSPRRPPCSASPAPSLACAHHRDRLSRLLLLVEATAAGPRPSRRTRRRSPPYLRSRTEPAVEQSARRNDVRKKSLSSRSSARAHPCCCPPRSACSSAARRCPLRVVSGGYPPPRVRLGAGLRPAAGGRSRASAQSSRSA